MKCKKQGVSCDVKRQLPSAEDIFRQYFFFFGWKTVKTGTRLLLRLGRKDFTTSTKAPLPQSKIKRPVKG